MPLKKGDGGETPSPHAKKLMKILLAAILTVFFVSCTAVPQTDISYVPGVGGKLPTVRIKAPKDVDIQGFELVRDGTGQSTLKIKSYRARMNPLIIEAQSARDVDLVNAIGTQVITGMSEGAKLFATGGASSAIGGSRPIGASRPVGGTNTVLIVPVAPSP